MHPTHPMQQVRKEASPATQGAAALPLPGYTNWLCNTEDPLMCHVLPVHPRIRMPWHYTPEQEKTMEGDAWECDAVWVHCACICDEVATDDLRSALETLRQDVDTGKAQYTLLVDPAGMSYDPRRLGGDHQIRVAETGRVFTFSVRRGSVAGSKILLAIDWNILSTN